MPESATNMLEVEDLHAYYGKSHILQGVSFRVGEGEIVSLLGRNGVGRSTTVKAIMGEVAPSGSVRFKGKRLPANQVTKSPTLGWAMYRKTEISSLLSLYARI